MNDDEVRAKAHRAELELRETEEVYQKLRQAMSDKLFATPLENAVLRERIYMAVQSMDTMRAMLREAVAAGDMVNHTILLAEHGFQR